MQHPLLTPLEAQLIVKQLKCVWERQESRKGPCIFYGTDTWLNVLVCYLKSM